MNRPALYLFDDARAARWAPFASTRPVGELLLGTRTLRGRAEAVLGTECAAHLVRSGLAGFDEPGTPPCRPIGHGTDQGARILLSSRVALRSAPDALGDAETATRLTMDGVRVGWMLPAGAPDPSPTHLSDPSTAAAEGPEVALDGDRLSGPWDLVGRNTHWLQTDLVDLERSAVPAGVTVLGDGGLILADDAEIEPGVVVDTRDGPVMLADGARAQGPARLTGPLWIGPGSTVLGGVVGGSSIGPVCKVRGEVAESIFVGYANKAHDGHLGHALVGRWVNLGAGTTNSDLKNNYGPVRVATPDGEVDTGLMKVGCFLGDHAKTAIGTLLNTGTVVGAGANVFGAEMPPKDIPAFSWGGAPGAPAFALDRFFEVAERAMARRAQELTPGVRAVLERAWRDAWGD